MSKLRASNRLLWDMRPYDPKYLPAQVMVSANETTCDVPPDVRKVIESRLSRIPFNRYPDPMANALRDAIAAWHGLSCEHVICGNGGDELLFDLALAWGGNDNALLTTPPTFGVYATNARLTGTYTVEVARTPTFEADEEAILTRAGKGDIGMVIIANPNNPTGNLVSLAFIGRLCEASDALVLIDEAYMEFAPAGSTALPLLAKYENLAILRTFSKAYRLAGVRMGYLLAHPCVISELTKVRQPYSVDCVSQAIALEVVNHREAFSAGIELVKAERERLARGIAALPGTTVHPSAANFLFVKFDQDAATLWQQLYDQGILVRDFSADPLTDNCLRISVGSPDENDRIMQTLQTLLVKNTEHA